MGSKHIPVIEEEDAALLKFPKEFESAETLTVAEVLQILNMRQEQSKKDEVAEKPNEVFVRTLEHCRNVNKLGDNKERIQYIRRILQTKKLHKFELAQLANLYPESAEEARALIPTLENNFQDEELNEILLSMGSS